MQLCNILFIYKSALLTGGLEDELLFPIWSTINWKMLNGRYCLNKSIIAEFARQRTLETVS